MNLVDELKRRQGRRSQAEFARELGITPAALSLIYLGRRQVGGSVARRIRARYPELVWHLAESILGDARDCA